MNIDIELDTDIEIDRETDLDNLNETFQRLSVNFFK
jgi:hypothetical protein